MRKALLVITLVAASFAGGAVVNGPGLAWVRSNLGLSLLEIERPPERRPRDITPKAHPSDPPPTGRLSEAPAGRESGAPRPVRDAGPDRAISRADHESRAAGALTPPRLEAPSSEETRKLDDAPSAPAAPGAVLDRIGSTIAEPPRSGAVVSPGRETASQTNVKSAGDGATNGLAAGAQPFSDGLEWRSIAKRMESMGVQRYWIEGESGRTVRFRCVVPLIGTTAVAQMFEGEAADLESAANLVLQRVALWKATERD